MVKIEKLFPGRRTTTFFISCPGVCFYSGVFFFIFIIMSKPNKKTVPRRSDFFHRKILGQHFLKSKLIAERIIEALGPLEQTHVMEIGAGKGILSLRLVDRAASEEERGRIEALAASVAGVRDVHAVRTRYLGEALAVDLHIEVDAEMTVRKGHLISEAVQEKILRSGPNVIDAVVHLEPAEND